MSTLKAMKINDNFFNNLEEMKERGKTGKLWVQYIEMVALAKSFIRFEKIGCLKDQITILQQMLSYFFSAGHFNYTQSAYLYIQNRNEFISDAEVQIHRRSNDTEIQEWDNFVNGGYFTKRRTEKFWSGSFTDMVIEQELMRAIIT